MNVINRHSMSINMCESLVNHTPTKTSFVIGWDSTHWRFSAIRATVPIHMNGLVFKPSHSGLKRHVLYTTFMNVIEYNVVCVVSYIIEVETVRN